MIGPKRIAHLVSRFFASLHPRALDAATVAWVAEILQPGELHLWEGLEAADRAESVMVARRFEGARGVSGAPDAEATGWVAAALLHDVGKQASAYGPIGRAVATVVIATAGDQVVRGWVDEPGRVRARMGRYAAHDNLGAELLRVAGARPVATAWAEAHHRPDHWEDTGIPPEVCRALAIADGEPGS